MPPTPTGADETPDASPVLHERRGAVLVLTLNRPDRLNAVTRELYDALAARLEQAASDPELRAVVLTGAGRAFCVGADLVAHEERSRGAGPREGDAAYVRRAGEVNLLLQTIPRPVVAAVNGHAVGAGLELALSCDLVVAAEDAKLRLPEAALGTFVGGGVTRTLPRRVGDLRARELLLLCPFVTGREAAGMGMVNRAVEASEVLPVALGWAEELARRAPISVALLKALLHDAPTLTAEALIERENQALLECMETDDWREGVQAFREKREPRYGGR